MATASLFAAHALATAQAALPFLAKGGSITFVSAVTAHAAMPGTAGIGAANAAVAALVPILAAELKPLRVNGVVGLSRRRCEGIRLCRLCSQNASRPGRKRGRNREHHRLPHL